jgi:PilZ domain
MSRPGLDKRRSRRKPFDYVGVLDFRDGQEPRPCQIADISAGGARLRLFNIPSTIPKLLTLVLSPRGNVRRDCKIVWRSTHEIGVRFVVSKPEARATEVPA